jgi:hypothetical protein
MTVETATPPKGEHVIISCQRVCHLVVGCSGPKNGKNTASPSAISGLWVKMLHNEREILFPSCTAHGNGTIAPSQAAPTPHSKTIGPHYPNSPSCTRRYCNATTCFCLAAYGLHYPCPWEVVKDYYRSVVYDRHGIQSCDAEDWARLCGGVTTCEDESDD